MVHKAGLPKPLPFLRALEMETCRSQEILSVVEVGQDSPAAEELSSSHAPAGAEGPGTLLLGGIVVKLFGLGKGRNYMGKVNSTTCFYLFKEVE